MPEITKEKLVAAVHTAAVVAGAIRTLGSVPSGHLYARVMDKMDLETYNAIIAMLKRATLVSESGYLLTWTGPKI